MSISEARKSIFKIAEKIQKPGVYYTLTEKGKPKAVVISADEFESWQETLEMMHVFPKLEKDIEKAEREYRMERGVDTRSKLSYNKLNQLIRLIFYI